MGSDRSDEAIKQIERHWSRSPSRVGCRNDSPNASFDPNPDNLSTLHIYMENAISRPVMDVHPIVTWVRTGEVNKTSSFDISRLGEMLTPIVNKDI